MDYSFDEDDDEIDDQAAEQQEGQRIQEPNNGADSNNQEVDASEHSMTDEQQISSRGFNESNESARGASSSTESAATPAAAAGAQTATSTSNEIRRLHRQSNFVTSKSAALSKQFQVRDITPALLFVRPHR